MYPDILHNFSCWVDNRGKIGVCDTVKLPKLEYLKDDHIGGGMTGKQEIRFMAHDVLKAEAHFIDFDAKLFALFGLGPRAETAFQFRGALSAEGTDEFKAAVCYVKGFAEIEPEEWKVAAKTGKTVPLSLSYLHLTIADQSILKLEPATATWDVNGQSVLRGLKQALG